MQYRLQNVLILLTLTMASLPLAAAPTGYSINSDSPSANADSLYRIDLGTGVETWVGTVKSLSQTRIDVEGLAFAPDGTLYGVDDDSLTLFPLNPENGVVQTANEVIIKGLPAGGSNDFGMTFACDGNLYITSVTRGSLYRLELSGSTQVIGSQGSLSPVKISAIAAYGNPVRVYGLGNGSAGGQSTTPNLYEIDLATGAAILIGPLGPAAALYLEGGLAFDDSGQLWAVTDRSQYEQPSQVMKIDRNTGLASEVKSLGERGFESLAITVPRGCEGGEEDVARFAVQKHYLDGNDRTPVTLNIQCQTGLPLRQSTTVLPDAGPFDPFEVNFIVGAFEEGALNCEVWESEPTSYSASYSCFSDGVCTVSENGCSFTGVTSSQQNLCVVRNYPDPVIIQVSKEWVDTREGLTVPHDAEVELFCTGLLDGDGSWSDATMIWRWDFSDGSPPVTATVYPRFDGATRCQTRENTQTSAVESSSTCENWTSIPLGAGSVSCALVNTVFFEGIPTLQPLGIAITALLLLLTGLVATRRF